MIRKPFPEGLKDLPVLETMHPSCVSSNGHQRRREESVLKRSIKEGG